MKYETLVRISRPVASVEARMVRTEAAILYVGSREFFAKLESDGLVWPTINRHKLKLYDLKLIDRVLDRLTEEAQ
jgi:hypothetical protein